ncbi:ATP-binding protein [Haliangium sp.]|uniref:ATP-binding protein n=1 Tax=Haliangium sp. TaxID=2663208 RepID=UPI003D0E17E6
MTAGFSGAFPAIPDRNRLNFSWLLKLRWAQIAGQVATVIGVEWFLTVEVPLAALVAIIGVGMISNLIGAAWFQSRPAVAEWHLAVVMAIDVALLTGLLYFTGGPANPFSFLYLVQIALAAVVLHAQWTWMLVALSMGAFGVLVWLHRPLAGQAPVHDHGAWIALGVAAAFIVHFLRRVTAALAQRERELAEANERALRQERLASLATMSAGAAHELSTPLGTIAVVAKELERALVRQGDQLLIEDAQLIREQVSRCRGILDQMSGGAGEYPIEGIETVTVAELMRESMTSLRPAPVVRLDVAAGASGVALRLPPRAMVQALRSVVHNAQDASPPANEVVVAVTRTGAKVTFEVIDRGAGMSAEVLERAGEPFFTTKEPGSGMGLGLFLARAVVERAGGSLGIDSHPGQGTCVTVSLPVAP